MVSYLVISAALVGFSAMGRSRPQPDAALGMMAPRPLAAAKAAADRAA